MNNKKWNFKAYINNEFIETKENQEILSPWNDQVIGTVSLCTTNDIDNAFKVAKKSFLSWKKLELSQRITYIKSIARTLEAHKEVLAEIMEQEIAKNKKDGIVEVERSVEYINKTINTWEKIKSCKMIIKNKINEIYRIPLGVVLAISPFNYPINLAITKIIPALLVGNTVVWKSATNGSLVAGKIMEIIDKINLPLGVLNHITGAGRDIGDYLITHKDSNMISFTGSVNIGKKIAKLNSMKPIVLELGGNDAAYLRNDADIEKSITKIISGAFGYAGQRCTAIKRLILHKDISIQAIELLKKQISNLKTTPIINKSATNWAIQILNEKNNQNKILVGAKVKDNFVEPTLMLTNKESLAWKEEAFAPILPIIIVNDDKEAIELINDTNYGLQNSIFTKDIKWAKSLYNDIESGSLNINGASSRGPDEFPFLGIKDSGFNTQGIEEALISMTRYINIVINND